MPSWLESIWTAFTDSKIWYSWTKGLVVTDIIDILAVAFIIYNVLLLTRATRANQVLKGVAVLLVVAAIAAIFHLTALQWIFAQLVPFGFIAIVILFQPELRRVLEQIGRGSMLDVIRPLDASVDQDALIDEIIKALLAMSKRKVGALIVIERRTRLGDVVETGTAVDARISAALLENIFEPNTPLHDGAVVLRDERVAAAGCFLQLTEDSGLSRELGTRHRAAIGVTEGTDALSLIVSEETGIISSASRGKLTRYLDTRSLRELLSQVYVHEKEPSGIKSLMKRRGKHE